MEGFDNLIRFNAGLISQFALARIDMKRVAMSAALMTNWMPRVLGSMMLRPGTRYIYEATTGNNPVRYIPFVFATNDTALIEMSFQNMRVLVGEQVVSRVSVGTVILNGTFAGNLNDWTQNDDADCTSAYATGNFMSLVGTNFAHAKRYQQVTVASGDENKEHGIHIVIAKGYVDLQVGVTAGDTSYLNVLSLGPGEYSFAITPSANFFIQFQAATRYASLVQSVAIEAAGGVNISTPFVTADLANICYDQSADVIFMAINGYQQYKINRYAPRSWALVKFFADDGPFELQNTDQSVQLAPTNAFGDIAVSASSPFFTSSMVGSLLRIASTGQFVTETLTGANQFTDPIEVTGVGGNRAFNLIISGTFSATISLQQSVGAPGAWTDVATYTGTENISYNDGFDNSVIYYRIGIDPGNYTSGSAVVSLNFAGGSINGICRISAYNSATSVDAYVLSDFGGTSANSEWSLGSWSSFSGYPTAFALFQGRAWWAGHDTIIGSVSDAYGSYDDTVVGDSGPLNLSIGSGPVDVINWILGGLLLLMGGQGAEHSLSNGYLGTPITPTGFTLRNPSNFGSANVQMQKIDWNGVFVKKDGVRVCMSAIENAYFAFDYKTTDLTLAVPEIGLPGVTRIGIQRIPDTRIHCVRADGKVAVNVWDNAEDVKAWLLIDLGPNAWVEDVVILPPLAPSWVDPNNVFFNTNGYTTLIPEDTVYYAVRRIINGQTVRYLERWSWETECQGGTLSKQVDCHLFTQNTSPSVFFQLPQLAGQTVVVWGDGIYQGEYTCDSSGNIQLNTAVTNVVAGLPYTAQFQSAKLARDLQGVTGLAQMKKIDHLSLIMVNTHYQGLQYGNDFNNLDDLPLVENGEITAANTIWSQYDEDAFEFNDIWNTDSRLCLQAQSPFPVTILAAVLKDSTNVKG